jgi:pSer/pThr/pTyr-binding forkhead associated (FHA) protein
VLDDPAVADYHAVITYESRPENYGYYLYPGAEMKRNGQTVQGAVHLASGDRLGIGSTELVFLTVELT